MGITMRLADAPGVVVEWFGARGTARYDASTTGLAGVAAAQLIALAVLTVAPPPAEVGYAAPANVPSVRPRPTPEPPARGKVVNVCKMCLRRHRNDDYMYCSPACRKRAADPATPKQRGRRA